MQTTTTALAYVRFSSLSNRRDLITLFSEP